MPQDALEESLSRPFGVKARAGGPTLIARRAYFDYLNVATDKVPLGAGRATVRCVGAGGSHFGSATGGGGGAYARSDILCSAGQSLTVTIGAPKQQNGGPGGTTSVVLAGKTVSAAGGNSGASPANSGGQASASTGDVTRSGGQGSVNGTGQPGTGGGTGGVPVNNYGGGGGSAGDLIDLDSLGLGGKGGGGGTAADGTAGGLPAGYGGGGSYPSYSGAGIAIIEFWSA